MRALLLIAISIAFFACKTETPSTVSTVKLKPITFNSEASFRGIHGNDTVVYIAGSGGEVWKYDLLTEQMINISPDTNRSIQYRDVEVLDNSTAIIATAGFPAKLLKTKDGGKTWQTVLHITDSLAFIDGIDFQNKNEGVVFGDPLNDTLVVYTTQDAGETWQKLTNIPQVNTVEAGFAASGTSVIMENDTIYIGLGGDEARLFVLSNSSAKAINTAMAQGKPSQGIYSIAKWNNTILVIGGQYDAPEDDSTHCFSVDNGRTWQLATGVNAYRSCVSFVNEKVAIACGPSGIDLSNDGGLTWEAVDSTGVHAMYWQKNSTMGFASGANGMLYEINLQ